MRDILTEVLDGYGQAFAGWWLQGRHPSRSLGPMGRDGLLKELYNLQFKDEFEYLIDAIRSNLGGHVREAFDVGLDKLRADHPREDEVFERELVRSLAVDKRGDHVGGRTGRVIVGNRFVGMQAVEVEPVWSIRRRKMLGLDKSYRETVSKIIRVQWPIYAGEDIERQAIDAGERRFVQEGLDIIDPLPSSTPIMATNTRISNEIALLMANACVDNLDEGSGAAVIQGRTGTQPTDPDTTSSGTNLFTLTCSDPAFGNAADGTPGGVATASSITDDSSADATNTLGYCRASSTNDGATPLDDHIDGEAGTSGADFNFNTLSIVSGSTVSLTSWTVTMPES